MRLRNLIIVTVIVPLFLVLMVFSLVAIKSLEDNVRSKLETEVQTISRAIGTSLGNSLTRESPESDRKSTRLNSSHVRISYAVFCLKKKKKKTAQLPTRTKQITRRLKIPLTKHTS